jgi:hypothetical protein
VVALLAGFALAIAGLALTVVRGVRRDGGLALAPARLGLALTLIGAVCWTLAAFNA